MTQSMTTPFNDDADAQFFGVTSSEGKFVRLNDDRSGIKDDVDIVLIDTEVFTEKLKILNCMEDLQENLPEILQESRLENQVDDDENLEQ